MLAASLDGPSLDRLALTVREDLAPGLSVTEALPLAALVHGRDTGGVRVTIRGLEALPPHVWAVTEIRGQRARIWLHRDAWHELPREVHRTRFSVAHELAHIHLHRAYLQAHHLDDATRSRIESEADRAAAQILVPDCALERMPGTVSAEAVSERFGVSAATAARRLREWRNSS